MATKQEPGFAMLIFLLIFAFLCSNPLVTAISTLKLGDQLDSTSQLVSEGGNFTLGFFTIDATDYGYLGIWYTNEILFNGRQATRVWVANPDTPIETRSGVNPGVLKIDSTGKLVITTGARTILNISEGTDTVNLNATATLEDTGNFVLRDESNKQILWQSFDHSTNVLLPGMKLGYNLRTGRNWTLNSWVSDQVPASGSFSLSWEPTQESGQLVMHRRGNSYWTSGTLENQTFKFMGINYLYDQYHYNLSYISNDDEKSFTFNAIGETSMSPMLVLSPNGGVRVEYMSINFRDSPDDFCYGYESHNGCVLSNLPKCRSKIEKFEDKRAIFGPKTSIYLNFSSGPSLSDCMERCWKECDCLGFSSFSSITGMGCNILIGSNEYKIDERGSVELIYLLVSVNSSGGSSPKIVKSSKGKSALICIFVCEC